MFNVDKTRTAPRAVVTKNNVHNSQANLDFSEEAVSGNSQHDNIMGGQGLPTNQDGTQANTDFSPEAIKGSSVSQIGSGDPNLRTQSPFTSTFDASKTYLGRGGNDSNIFSSFYAHAEPTETKAPEPPVVTWNDKERAEQTVTENPQPTPEQTPTDRNAPEDFGFTQGYQDPSSGKNVHGVDAGFTISNNFFRPDKPTNSVDLFSSNKMTNDQYVNTLALQRENNKSNVSNMAGYENLGKGRESQYTNMKPEDFFSGTKSGNTISTPFSMDGMGMTRENKTIKGTTKSYKDVNVGVKDEFGNWNMGSDSFDIPEFSNANKNKKALQDQFDLYSGF